MDDMWKYVVLVKHFIAQGSRITAFSALVYGLISILPGIYGSSTKAQMFIPSGSRVNMFDLYNMKGVECNSSTSESTPELFRSKHIDIKRGPECPSQVWIYFDNPQFSLRFNPSSGSTTLKSWMKEKPKYLLISLFRIENVTVDTSVPDYDFVMYEDSTNNVFAAVYNKRDDVIRPRFFYKSNALPISAVQGSLTAPNTPATFDEANLMEILLVFDNADCNPVTNAKMYNTCAEALETEYCPCDCAYYDKLKYWEDNPIPEGLTEDEKLETVRPEMEATKKQLTVNKTELSSFRNKKISASDERSSAKGLGMLGAVTLGLVFGSLVLCDLVSLKRHANNIRGTCSCVKT